jgi:hypothetical protein
MAGRPGSEGLSTQQDACIQPVYAVRGHAVGADTRGAQRDDGNARNTQSLQNSKR